MNRAGLIDILREYGADADGIAERFAGDARLYRGRLDELLYSPEFDALARDIDKSDLKSAFARACSLKGPCAALGLTPLYESVCVLEEILRPGEGETAQTGASALKSAREQLITVRERLAKLRLAAESAPREYDPPTRKSRKVRKSLKTLNRTMIAIAVSIIALSVAGAFVFSDMINGYKKNVEHESAAHLIEIGGQIRLCVEMSLENDWETAKSVASGVTQTSGSLSDEDILAYMRRERDIWGVSDITLYNEAGYTVSSSGAAVNNDTASDAAYYAKKNGEHMTVARSLVSYIVPVETSATIDGVKIVAAGVVRDISSFVDGLGISSFGGNASVYLTDGNGVVMSRLSANSEDTFNITTLLGKSQLYDMDGQKARTEELLSLDEPKAYILKGRGEDMYVVSESVNSRRMNMRLFYMAPAKAVNENMSVFSDRITHLSVTAIAVFAFMSFCAFALAYNDRKRMFTSVLSKRERTFDLLVKNSQTAFALFTPLNPDEQFISANAERIIGGERMVLEKADEGYRMAGADGRQTDVSAAVNEKMKSWDGKSEFHSGYIPRGGRLGGGYFEITLYPLDEGVGEYVGIAQDASVKHDREEAVRVTLDMARRSDEAKTRFLSNMSHDIRTPLNAIINMARFARDSVGDPETQTGYLDIISESSDHLLSLINDILDVSRIESGQSVIGKEPFDIRSEVLRVVEIIKPLAAAKKQRFTTDFSKAYTRYVLGDKLKLGQILVNILGNAVKFTPGGGHISFSATEITTLGRNLATFSFVVADDGVGISQEHLPRIFDPFMRADDKSVRAQEGTGLGLSICQSFVSAMGGSIKCESELGKGSVFTVEITFNTTERAADIAPKSVKRQAEGQFAGKRCLVFEDNPTNQIIAGTILEKCGFEVEIAEDGKCGIEKFLSSKSDYYDIIYMDIRMPEINGYEAAAAIRESGREDGKNIPIIAMTANVFAEDVEKSRKAGMNGHLGKPIVVGQLIELSEQALKQRGGDH